MKREGVRVDHEWVSVVAEQLSVKPGPRLGRECLAACLGPAIFAWLLFSGLSAALHLILTLWSMPLPLLQTLW